MTNPANPAAPRAAAWRGEDFPAWMSPMLVKELRQGVQSGAFAWTFVLLQAAMFVLMTLWLLERSSMSGTADSGFFHGTFWWLFGLAAMLAIPLRASFSMVAERQGQTLDLLRLTRLSSTQIVFGKWLSTMAQVALLAVAVLPYVVLQYFFGGLDVVTDLATLLLVLLGASVVTAVSIATSGQSAVTRGFLVLVIGYAALVSAGAGGLASMGMLGATVWASLGVMSAIVTAVFLEYAAAGIAPAAENHAARIRSLVLLTCLLALVASRFVGIVSTDMLGLFAIVLSLGVSAAELTTDAVPVASVHARFARFGPPGKLAAIFLAPGWATGVLFLLLSTGVCMAAIAATSTGDVHRSIVRLALAAAAVAFPLPLMVFFPAGRKRWTAAVLVGAASMAIYYLTNMWLASSRGGPWGGPQVDVPHFLPLPALFRATFDFSGASPGPLVALPLPITGLALAFVAPRWLREMGALLARLRDAARQPAGTRARRP